MELHDNTHVVAVNHADRQRGIKHEGAGASECEQVLDQQDECSELGLERRECSWLLRLGQRADGGAGGDDAASGVRLAESGSGPVYIASVRGVAVTCEGEALALSRVQESVASCAADVAHRARESGAMSWHWRVRDGDHFTSSAGGGEKRREEGGGRFVSLQNHPGIPGVVRLRPWFRRGEAPAVSIHSGTLHFSLHRSPFIGWVLFDRFEAESVERVRSGGARGVGHIHRSKRTDGICLKTCR